MTATIYDQIGGEAAVTAAVDEFYDRVLSDPTLTSKFNGINLARLKKHQIEFMTTALGGRDHYTGESMSLAHAGLGITNEQFERVVDHFSATLVHLGVDLATVGVVAQKLMGLKEDITNK